MNIQPWIDGDLAAQEAEGYKDGQLHSKQGCSIDYTCDSETDTPYLRGYKKGWDEIAQSELFATEPIDTRRDT